jgi:hypothetical protein
MGVVERASESEVGESKGKEGERGDRRGGQCGRVEVDFRASQHQTEYRCRRLKGDGKSPRAVDSIMKTSRKSRSTREEEEKEELREEGLQRLYNRRESRRERRGAALSSAGSFTTAVEGEREEGEAFMLPVSTTRPSEVAKERVQACSTSGECSSVTRDAETATGDVQSRKEAGGRWRKG